MILKILPYSFDIYVPCRLVLETKFFGSLYLTYPNLETVVG